MSSLIKITYSLQEHIITYNNLFPLVELHVVPNSIKSERIGKSRVKKKFIMRDSIKIDLYHTTVI